MADTINPIVPESGSDLGDISQFQGLEMGEGGYAAHLGGQPEGLSLFDLVLHASPIAQLVIVILIVLSVWSWAIIFNRIVTFRKLRAADKDFEREFWSGRDLEPLYETYRGRRGSVDGQASVFVAGYQEFTRLGHKASAHPDTVISGVQRAMNVAINEEEAKMERQIPFLATIGSVSPYIGLLGTVYGIMNSFQAIGAMKQATVASVAPGIAEALVATAIGLFAAIPAVIAYNRFANTTHRFMARYDAFADEFTSIVSRHALDSEHEQGN